MSAIPADILHELEALRDGFRASAVGAVREIANAWSEAVAPPTRDRLEDLMAKAHRLAGTAATFALAEISQPASALETLLTDLLTADKLDAADLASGEKLVAQLQASV